MDRRMASTSSTMSSTGYPRLTNRSNGVIVLSSTMGRKRTRVSIVTATPTMTASMVASTSRPARRRA
jgi:hypothetical protein